MYLRNISFMYLIMSGVFLSALRLSNYVSNYQLTKIRISRGVERNYLSLTMTKPNSRKSEPSIRVRFSSFGQNFDFIATKSEDYDQATIENIGYMKSKVSGWKPEFYEVQNDSRHPTSAFGYIQDNVFVGFAIIGNITYFLESAAWYFPKYGKNSSIIVYRNLDVMPPMNQTIDPSIFSIIKNNLSTSLGRFVKRSENLSKDKELVCKMEIVGDNTLFQRMQNNVEMTIALLLLHVKFADRIFRSTDFGLPTVRIVPENVVVYIAAAALSSTFPDSLSQSTSGFFLNQFSHRIQNSCLSMCICDRKFEGNIIGVSYTAVMNDISGGICQTKGAKDVILTPRLNTGVVTLRSPKNEQLPLAISMPAFTHEVGHLFGSDHDPLNSFTCSPNEDFSHYIMYPEIPKSITFTSIKFSPCSIKNISRVIQRYGSCMNITAPVICGNSIREGNEECDCGHTESICKSVDACCTPKGGLGSDTECTFKRSFGNECSPVENSCCDKNCRVTIENRQCFFDDESCLSSYCDGKSKDCPNPSPSADGTPCMFTSRTCLRGSCNSTICLDNKLEDCLCSRKELVCHVCCRRKSEKKDCVPAWMLGFHTPDGGKYTLKPDTPCGNNQSACDISGTCSSLFPREKFKKTNTDWIVIIALCSGFVALSICIFFGVRKIANLIKESPTAPSSP